MIGVDDFNSVLALRFMSRVEAFYFLAGLFAGEFKKLPFLSNSSSF